MTQSHLEEMLVWQVKAAQLPEPVQQFRLPEIPDRKFAFDLAWPGQRLLCEVQGGTWLAKAGHNSGNGIERDTEKAALAVLHGWRLLQVTALQIKDGRALVWLSRLLGVEG